MTANKKRVDDCDLCKIASNDNCRQCDVLSDAPYRWVERDGFVDVEWEKVPDKTGALE